MAEIQRVPSLITFSPDLCETLVECLGSSADSYDMLWYSFMLCYFQKVALKTSRYQKHSQQTMKRWQEHLWERWTSALRSEKHWNAPCLQRLMSQVTSQREFISSLSPFRKRPYSGDYFFELVNQWMIMVCTLAIQNVKWKQAWFRSSSKRLNRLRFHVYGWFLFKSVLQWISCSGILENRNERLSQSRRHCMQWVVRPSS